jgi:hypothetical protein
MRMWLGLDRFGSRMDLVFAELMDRVRTGQPAWEAVSANLPLGPLGSPLTRQALDGRSAQASLGAESSARTGS